MKAVPVALLLAGLSVVGASAPSSMRAGDELLPTGLHFYTGDFHAHTSFSDGEGTPARAFALARERGLDVLELTEHSELLTQPLDGIACFGGDQPLGCPVALSPTKWADLAAAADEATVPGQFVAMRGFEQTMDIQGHLTVHGSAGFIDRFETTDALMPPFWTWFTSPLPPIVLPDGHATSGADGLGAFAHPNSDKNYMPGQDSWRWDDFAYQPAADDRMAMIEAFNSGADHSMWYAHALDKGWHLAPTAVSDSHHLGFGLPQHGRTLLVAGELTPAAVRDALHARHVAATQDAALRLVLTSGAHLMGDRWSAGSGRDLALTVAWAGAAQPVARVDIVGNGGQVVATGSPSGTSFSATLTPEGSGEHYYFAKLTEQGGAMAYTAPVWVGT